jgi:hypothetical protein
MMVRAHRILMALSVLCVTLLLIGAVACTATTEEDSAAGPQGGRDSSTPLPEAQGEELGVQSGQSEQGPAQPVETVDLESVREQMRQGGGFWTLLQAEGAAGEQTYHVAATEDFRADFTIGNYEESPAELAFTCIVDFAQSPCLEGSAESIRWLELDAYEDATLQVHLSGLSEGLHDVIFAMFFYPSEHSSDESFRCDSRFMYNFDRISLYVGESQTTPSMSLISFAEPDDVSGMGMHAYSVSKRGGEEWEEAWHLEETGPGEVLEYYATRNNPETIPITYAFLGFLDFTQVPMDAEHLVVYAEVESGKRATIRGELTAPSELGDHEFLVLVVDNPYLDQSELPFSTYLLSADTYSSDRALIRVG